MPITSARPAFPAPRGAQPQGGAQLTPQQQQQSAAPQSAPSAPVTSNDTVSLSTVGTGDGNLGVQSSFDFSEEGDTAFVYPQASQEQPWSAAASDNGQCGQDGQGGGGFEAYA